TAQPGALTTTAWPTLVSPPPTRSAERQGKAQRAPRLIGDNIWEKRHASNLPAAAGGFGFGFVFDRVTRLGAEVWRRADRSAYRYAAQSVDSGGGDGVGGHSVHAVIQ